MGNLESKNILITSGPTRGYIDAVRYISNKSTGKLGAAIAIEALKRNACVTFVYGTGSSTPDITEKQSEGKIASIKDTLTITLRKMPKVIKQIRTLWPHAFLIGFKLEVGLSRDELVGRAYASMIESGADLVVANNQNEIDRDKHRAYLINSHKEVESRCETRQDIAGELMDLIAKNCSR